MDISVIIPSKNNAKTMQKAIESVENQTFSGSFEIIFVNDDSEDESEEILKRLQLRYANIRYLKDRFGSSLLARLKGIEEAKGDYVMFLDGDDYYSPFALQRMYESITSEEADIVNCGLYYVRAHSKRKTLLRRNRTYSREQAFKALFFDLTFRGYFHTKIYKREILSSLHPRFLGENNIYEDGLFNFLYLTKIKKAISIKDCLVYYNKANSDSLTKLGNNRVQDNINVRAKEREYLDSHGLEEIKKEFIKWRIRPKTLQFVDILLSSFKNKTGKRKMIKQANADLNSIFGKDKFEVEGRSYSEYLKGTYL